MRFVLAIPLLASIVANSATGFSSKQEAWTVTTFAGNGVQGSKNGAANAANFSSPSGIAVDAKGNLYVADTSSNLIRKITPTGSVSTFAGSGARGAQNGKATDASFSYPFGVAVDPSGNVFVADAENNLIRKITPVGVVSTLAGSETKSANGAVDGKATAARFVGPLSIALDASGNVYVADTAGHLIRKVTPAGVVSTLAGSGAVGATNGVGNAASFNFPQGIVVDPIGNIYVADAGNNLIRKITKDGLVSTLAGSGAQGAANGMGTDASFKGPSGLALDLAGNIYVSDSLNQLIRKVTPAGVVSTVAGSGAIGATNGAGATASFYSGVPNADVTSLCLAVDAVGNIYVADKGNNIIRKISPLGDIPALAVSKVDSPTAVLITPQTSAPNSLGNITVAEQVKSTTGNITSNGTLQSYKGVVGEELKIQYKLPEQSLQVCNVDLFINGGSMQMEVKAPDYVLSFPYTPTKEGETSIMWVGKEGKGNVFVRAKPCNGQGAIVVNALSASSK